jgi:Tol biopolymer transport system component
MNKKKNLIMVILLFAGVSFLFSSEIQQETAKELFEKALYLEETKGDLEKAIEVYKQVVKKFPDEQATAAKAQLQIGICYEKLGMKEAQTAYQQVIDKYPRQTDVVAVARARLTGIERSLAELNRQPKFRKIEIATKPQNGVLSPEGDRLAFISEGAVWVVPLHGKVDPDIAGEPVRIAEVPGVWNFTNLLAWSADGEWIAVNGEDDDEDAVYVIPVGGGEPRVIRMPERGGHAYSYRLSLSPDGQKLAISALKLGTRREVPWKRNRYIYTIPTAGGEPKLLSSSMALEPSFSPDGKFIAYVGFREREDWKKNIERERHDCYLWVVPSAGGTPVKLATVDGALRGPVWSPSGKYIAAHYEPGGDNDSHEIWVYPLSPDVSSASEPIKISLPRSSWNMLAGWTPEGEIGVFIESDQHSAIYTVPAPGGKAVQITSGAEWPSPVRWSSDGERVYFRRSYEEEGGISYVPAAGGDSIEIPLLSEGRLGPRVPGYGFNVSPDGKMIVISATQEPYDPKEGVDVWTIPVNGGRPTRLTNDGSFEGYPCWSPDGKWVAFIDWHAKSEDEGFGAIYVVPAEGGEIRQVTSEADSVDVEGGAIAFSPDGEHIAFFSGGAIKTIPVEGGKPEVLVAEVKSSPYSQLAYSPDGKKIAHNAEGKIWITPLDGGVPEELRTGLPKDIRLSEFSWSPDGEKIAFFASIGGDDEFWLISDFLPQKR